MALSPGEPTAPIEGASPASWTLAAEGPRGELNPAVAMDHQADAVLRGAGRHPERGGDERGRLGAVDRPADDEARERVEHDTAVDLALAGGVLGDVGHPQLVRGTPEKSRRTRSSERPTRPARAPRGSRRFGTPLIPRSRMIVRDRVVADEDVAAVAQLGCHAFSAVDAARGPVHVGDLAGQPDAPERRRLTAAGPSSRSSRTRKRRAIRQACRTLIPCPVRESITGKSLLGQIPARRRPR